MEIYYILQGIIYSMNEDVNRNFIVRSAISKLPPNQRSNYIWKGTFHLKKEEQFHFHKRWRKTSTNTYLFTVAYSYNVDLIHYVSFVLDMKKKQLLCFDPGYNLYTQGKCRIIPTVVNTMIQDGFIKNKIVLKTKCPVMSNYDDDKSRKYGLQFDGTVSSRSKTIPADAFCQTWTLFFLVTYIEKRGKSTAFFQDWCRIPPRFRQVFLLQAFVSPQCHSSEMLQSRLVGSRDHFDTFQSFLLKSFWQKL